MNQHVQAFQRLAGYLREKEAMGLLFRSGIMWHSAIQAHDCKRYYTIRRMLEPTWEKIIRPGIEKIVNLQDIRCERTNESPFIHVFFFAEPK